MWWCYLVIIVDLGYCIDNMEGWNYINLHCRDDHNAPVDWWYIYKPPADIVPYFELGHNFSYIASNEPSKWQSSDKHITSNSMLQHTMWPMYRESYRGRLAYLTYDSKQDASEGSSSHGILMADEMGGLWIGHTVPGFPNFQREGFPEFPQDETPNGHLLYCLSLDLVTVNEIAISLKHIQPDITAIRIPAMMKSHVPAWKYLYEGLVLRHSGNKDWLNRYSFEFVTRGRSLLGSIQVRRPGDSNCLYRDFARKRNIVLDIYGHGGNGTYSNHRDTLCTDKYSLRSIDRISLKLPESVSYIHLGRDRARFAVSTAAHWQRRGASAGGGAKQYWTCVTSLESEDKSGEGGVMFCAENYQVWLSFDSLKVAEPTC